MHSSVVLRVSDTRCVSPQTISSSGYHSDLSSTNDSPRSTHDHPLGYVGSYPSMRARKKADESKRTGLTQISDFIRKQYARAKSKFVCEKPQLRTVETCAKSTSTTTMPFLRDSQYQRRSIMVDRQPSAFVEPVRSVYVYPLQESTLKPCSSSNYSSIYDSYSQRPPRCLASQPKSSRSYVDSSAFRRPTMSYDTSERITRRCPSIYSQNYYVHKYLNKTYDQHQPLYVPLSDFLSTTDGSAFKPIRTARRIPFPHRYEPMPPSDDPCDLEVAHYLSRAPQRRSTTYFNTHRLDMPRRAPRKACIETLC